ncbi:MAG: hypothetical protein OS112_01955 [Methanoregula sp.]|nr:MAG: hypothetical protein OS112_01955 [Methanoregula sp.]
MMKPKPMMIPSFAVIDGIFANSYIIRFLLIYYPTQCAQVAAEIVERKTSGIETVAYVIATLERTHNPCRLFYLAKWSIPQVE